MNLKKVDSSKKKKKNKMNIFFKNFIKYFRQTNKHKVLCNTCGFTTELKNIKIVETFLPITNTLIF